MENIDKFLERERLVKKLRKYRTSLNIFMISKYFFQSLFCLVAILFPWYRLTADYDTFQVGIFDLEGFTIGGFLLILVLSVYAFQRIFREKDCFFTRKLEILSLVGLVLILDNVAYTRFLPGVGGRQSTTYLMRFNMLGYSITPLLGYLATVIVILLSILGLFFSFVSTYFLREYLYSYSD